MQNLDAKTQALIRALPDEKGARLFLERFAAEQPPTFQKLIRDPALLSDALALAAWSPLLATTLEQNPDYLSWLRRERADVRVRTRDQLKESLGRFALTNSALAPQALFARFRRRELLRICLHDVRRAHTLVTGGPYAWVRHPFYDAAALLMLSISLIAANWFFLLAGSFVLLLLVIRTDREEERLLARFGNPYREYKSRTGRFVPRLRPKK